MTNKPGRKPGSVPWNKGLKRIEDPRIPQPWLGKTRSETTRNKISVSKQGSSHTQETKDKISQSMSGRTLSKETKFRIAEAMHKLGRPESLRGTNNSRWIGNNRKSMKALVKRRDGINCRICGNIGVEVDHIIPRKDAQHLFSDPNNCQLLCKKCHRKKTNKEISHPKSYRRSK